MGGWGSLAANGMGAGGIHSGIRLGGAIRDVDGTMDDDCRLDFVLPFVIYFREISEAAEG